MTSPASPRRQRLCGSLRVVARATTASCRSRPARAHLSRSSRPGCSRMNRHRALRASAECSRSALERWVAAASPAQCAALSNEVGGIGSPAAQETPVLPRPAHGVHDGEHLASCLRVVSTSGARRAAAQARLRLRICAFWSVLFRSLCSSVGVTATVYLRPSRPYRQMLGDFVGFDGQDACLHRRLRVDVQVMADPRTELSLLPASSHEEDRSMRTSCHGYIVVYQRLPLGYEGIRTLASSAIHHASLRFTSPRGSGGRAQALPARPSASAP
jgi:hypothetical protein